MRQPSVELPCVLHLGPATDNIPNELKLLDQWACFYLTLRGNGKLGKPPINPITGAMASSTDPMTWGTFEKAVQYYETHRNDPQRPLSGIGFMFSENDPYCGIDLDDVIKEGKLEGTAAQTMDELDTYAEESFSGTGIHLIGRAELVGGGCNRGGIEIYDRSRFFVFTGRVFDGRGVIQSRQVQVDDLYLRAMAARKDGRASAPPLGDNSPFNVEINPCSTSAADVQAVIALILRDKSAGPLFRGVVASPKSQSDADMALCGFLAFYCGKDPRLMDSVFRQSGLFRPKWDSVRQSETYGERTIRIAIAGQRETWQRHYAPTFYSFPSELLDFSRIGGPVSALMLQVVYRKTVLFGKDDDWIADTQIAEAIHMKKIGVGLRRRSLQERNLLLVTRTEFKGCEVHQYRAVNLESVRSELEADSVRYSSNVCALPSALLDVAQIIGPAKTTIIQAVWRQPAGFYIHRKWINYRQLGTAIGLQKKAARKHCLALLRRKLLSTCIGEEGTLELKINLATIEDLVRIDRAGKPKQTPALRTIEKVQQKAAGSSWYPTTRTLHSPGEQVVMATDLRVISNSKTTEAQGPSDCRRSRVLSKGVSSISPGHTSATTLKGTAGAVTLVNFLREHDVHIEEAVAYSWLSDLLPEDWSAVNLAKYLYKRGILKTAACLPAHRAAKPIEKVLKDIARAQSSTRAAKKRSAPRGPGIVLVPGATTKTDEYFKTFFGIDRQSYQDKYDDQISAAIRRMDQKAGSRFPMTTPEAKAA